MLTACSSTVTGDPTSQPWSPPEKVTIEPIALGEKSMGYSPATGFAAVRGSNGDLCVSQVRNPSGAAGTTPVCWSLDDEMRKAVQGQRFATFSPSGSKVVFWGGGAVRGAGALLGAGDGKGTLSVVGDGEAGEFAMFAHWIDDNSFVTILGRRLVRIGADGSPVELRTWSKGLPAGLVGNGKTVAVLTDEGIEVLDASVDKPEPKVHPLPYQRARGTLLGVRGDGTVAVTGTDFRLARPGPLVLIAPDGTATNVPQADDTTWNLAGGFSTDGSQLLFVRASSEGKMLGKTQSLWRVPVSGGEPVELATLEEGAAKYFGPLTWTRSDEVYFEPFWSMSAVGFALKR